MYSTIVLILFLFNWERAISLNVWTNIPIYHSQVVPWRVRMFENTPIRLYCGSLSPVTWTYFKEHLPIPTEYQADNNSIKLMNLKEHHSGTYYCHGTYRNKANKITTFKNYILIHVKKQVDYGEVLPSKVILSEGSDLIIRCGSKRPAEWVSMNSFNKYSIEQGNTLSLKNLTKEHSGPYLCRGVNHLNNLFHAKAIIFVNPNIQSIPGSDLVFW